MRINRTTLIGAGLVLVGFTPAAGAQLEIDLESTPLDDAGATSQHDIEVIDNEFDPATFETETGVTVVWEQTGSNPHTVTADDGSFDSHPDCGTPNFLDCMGEGDTYSQTFSEAGTVAYYCKIHGGPGGEGMSGVIEVSASGEVTTTTAAASDTTSTTAATEEGPAADVEGTQALPTTGAQAVLGLGGTALVATAALLRRLRQG